MKHRRFGGHWILALLAACAAACSEYEYKGEQYTAEEALQVLQKEADAELAHVAPVEMPLRGSSTVVLPDLARLHQPGSVFQGPPPPFLGDTALAMTRIGNRAIASAIERGAVFQSVDVVEMFDPVSFPVRTDWAVVLDLSVDGDARWFLRRVATGQQERIPVRYYTGVTISESAPGLRLAEWPKAVLTAAAKFGPEPVAPAATSARTATPPPSTSPPAGVTEIKSLPSMGGRQRWTPADVVQVAISEADKNRIDLVDLPGNQPSYGVYSGPEWAQLFVGDTHAPTFTITSARVGMTFAGFHWRVHYDVQGTLEVDGSPYVIQAEGSIGAMPANWDAGVHDAVQLGIMDAARQAKGTIEVLKPRQP